MAQRLLENLRNIGIVAHIDAGKTTVTERMLYYSGAIHRMGEVDSGTTTTDFDAEEQQRGITIYSACVTFNWKGKVVNLIDTPGHVDFTAEVERSLRVLDGAVVVFSAREGVEAQSETVWRQADRYHVPRLCFINKLDREGADFVGTVEEIRKRLHPHPVPLQMPVGIGPSYAADPFRGIIDLVRMKLLTFDSESQGAAVNESEIPDELREEAELERGQLLERLYDYSDELMHLALAEEPVPEELVKKVIREATISHVITPVLCGSALHYMGIQPLLDAVADYLPAPDDLPPVEGVDPKDSEKKLVRRPDPNEPFCGLAFKIEAGRHGDLVFVRVYSGILKANTRAYNPGKDVKDNIAQLWHIQADRRDKQVELVRAGDIVGVIGPRHTTTGDTLCDPKHPILLESITFPETVISMAIEPETSADRKKLTETLEAMKRQDPTFRADFSEETGQTLISGMGELHLEIIKHRLLRDYNLNVKVHAPRVSYRETVAQTVEVTGRCHRPIGGQMQTAAVVLRLGPAGKVPPPPLPDPEEVDPQTLKLLSFAQQKVQERQQGSGYLGFPLRDVEAWVLRLEEIGPDSSEIAVDIAANDAFSKALEQAGPVLLEPIMRLEIVTPEEYLGDVIADMQQRRGIITRTTQRGKTVVLEAHTPLASLFGYSSAMRSLSQGRATCSMEPLEYAAAPAEVQAQFV